MCVDGAESLQACRALGLSQAHTELVLRTARASALGHKPRPRGMPRCMQCMPLSMSPALMNLQGLSPFSSCTKLTPLVCVLCECDKVRQAGADVLKTAVNSCMVLIPHSCCAWTDT